MYPLNRVIAPTVSAVSLAECKTDLRISGSEHDAEIVRLINDAIDYCEGPNGVIGLPFLTQTWEMTARKFEAKCLLPLAPVQSLASITYYDTDNAQQTYDVSNYILYGDDSYARIETLDTATLPSTYDRPDAVKIRFVVGFGDTAESVPASVRRAIRVLVSHWFDNPGAAASVDLKPIPRAFDSLAALHGRGNFG